MRLYKLRETVLDTGIVGTNGSGGQWCELSALDFNAACLASPFLESTGRLAVDLDGRFGGWSECIAAGPFDRERFASVLTPVHRRYRWYPPRGSTLLEGRGVARAFLECLDGLGLDGDQAACVSTECGFTDNVLKEKGARRHLTLQLPDGRRYLMFIGIPSRGDGREERIPWLHKVTDRGFADVDELRRSDVERCWDAAWSRGKRPGPFDDREFH